MTLSVFSIHFLANMYNYIEDIQLHMLISGVSARGICTLIREPALVSSSS